MGHGPDFCDVWNWDGGPGSHFKHSRCEQSLFGDGIKGGFATGVDVDAFTFTNEGYHVRFACPGQASCPWQWVEKGVWTKIRDTEIGDCGICDRNEIWCTVR